MNGNSRLLEDAKRDLAIAVITDQITALTGLMKKILKTNIDDAESTADIIRVRIEALDDKIENLDNGTTTDFAVPTPNQMKKIAEAAGNIGSVVGANMTVQAFLDAAVKIGRMYTA